MDVYRDMKRGSAQINPLSDFFQESERDMKTKPTGFDGPGYNLGYGIPAYNIEKEDKYDYSKPVYYDYTREN